MPAGAILPERFELDVSERGDSSRLKDDRLAFFLRSTSIGRI